MQDVFACFAVLSDLFFGLVLFAWTEGDTDWKRPVVWFVVGTLFTVLWYLLARGLI